MGLPSRSCRHGTGRRSSNSNRPATRRRGATGSPDAGSPDAASVASAPGNLHDSSQTMFVHQSQLAYQLVPADYSAPAQHRRELERLMLPAWHLVGSRSDLPGDGQFISRELLGQPVVVHNFQGQLKAFLNVSRIATAGSPTCRPAASPRSPASITAGSTARTATRGEFPTPAASGRSIARRPI